MARSGGTAEVHLTFADGSSTSVRSGAFAQIAAKRQYGLNVIKSGDPEVVLYSTWIELYGPPSRNPAAQEVSAAEAFDTWLGTITDMQIGEDEEDDSQDPTQADLSDSLPDSPPI